MDQSTFPRPLQTTRTYCLGPPALFQPTMTFPGPSILIPTSPDHQRHPSLQNYPGPVKASQSTAENQDLYLILHDHQHCSKPTTTFHCHSQTYPNCSKPSMPSPITLQNYHGSVKVSQTTPNNQDLLFGTTSTVPTNHDISWSLHTYLVGIRSPTPSPVIPYPPQATQSFIKASQSFMID